MEEIKKAIESAPELKAFINEVETLAEESQIPTNQEDLAKSVTTDNKEETTLINEAKQTTETKKTSL